MKNNVIGFPIRKQDDNVFGELDAFESAVSLMEKRLGVKLANLENGDPIAEEISSRALRKEVMLLRTQDLNC